MVFISSLHSARLPKLDDLNNTEKICPHKNLSPGSDHDNDFNTGAQGGGSPQAQAKNAIGLNLAECHRPPVRDLPQNPPPKLKLKRRRICDDSFFQDDYWVSPATTIRDNFFDEDESSSFVDKKQISN